MNYPYELLRVPGTEAVETLKELRLKGSGVPVILGGQDAFERVLECMELNEESSPEQLIEAARTLDAVVWLAEREEEDSEYYEIEASSWPEDNEPPNTSITAHREVLSRKPYKQVFITVLPTKEPWTAPCYLKIGNWNSVPKAEEHAALFRFWSEKYGATVACIADDIIEMTVDRPPSTREEALALAKQQYIYCADIVHQGLGSVEALAANLLGATVWYFWWD